MWTVFFYELMVQGRRRAYLLMTFGLPIAALVAFFGYQIYDAISNSEGTTESGPITFEDYDPVGYVDALGQLPDPIGTAFEGKLLRYTSEEQATRAVDDGLISAYYVLADDYLETGHVDLVSENLSLTVIEESDLFEAYVLNSFLIDEDLVPIFIRLQNPANLTENRIQSDGQTETRDVNTDFWLAYVFALALFVATLSASGYLMQSVIEERETRMIEILMSSVKPLQLLTGKTLALGLLGFFQIALWLGTATFVMTQVAKEFVDLSQFEVPPDVLVISIFYFIGGYLMIGSGFAAIGAISNNMREGPQLATIITLPSVVPLWVMTLIVTEPNSKLAVILSLFPLTAPMTMVMRASIIHIPLLELVASIILMIGAIVVMLWGAARLFRINNLLAGNPPKLRDIPRLLFG